MSSDEKLDAAAGASLVDRYLERHAEMDLDGLLELFAEDACVEDPVGHPAHHGREALRAFYRETHARQGRLVFERVGPALVGGGEIAVHVRARLARASEASAMDVIYTIGVDAEGRIASLRAYF